MLRYSLAWISVKEISNLQSAICNLQSSVSIVIAARNEENNISNCINDIIKQNYPKELFEIIIVDDASTDNTVNSIEKIILKNSDCKINLLKLKDDTTISAHKKRAISEGIKNATRELIITTDADCRMNENWLSSIISFYEKNNCKMIIAPVQFLKSGNIFQKFQQLEFTGLIGITAAAAFLNEPIMCNGANLLYEKNAFNSLNGFESSENKASGDDVFLMLKFKKEFSAGAIKFIKSKDAIVWTSAKSSVSEFISQRKRWASKSTNYNDFSTTIVALIVFLTNISIVVSIVLLFINPVFIGVCFTVFGIKCVVDFIFFLSISKFFGIRNLLWVVIPEQLLYIFYVAIIATIAPFGSYEWKGRRVK